MLATIKRIFRSYFITGLLVLGPLLISVFVVKAIVEAADSALQTSRWAPYAFPGLGLVIAVTVICLAGVLTRHVFGEFFFKGAGDLVEKIPLLGVFYSGTKQVFETLLGDQNKNFGRVVLVQYPHAGTWTLAFVTAEHIPHDVQKRFQDKMISVYVPTTPNPTSGFYIYVAEKDTRPSDLSVDEAFKVIVSLGLVSPSEVKTFQVKGASDT
ncbi:MAG: DUF502 domain-containing protein [Oligoflexia bacterium]|nr:DUF502 domain-containing protein [Oligoflexia bacterium]